MCVLEGKQWPAPAALGALVRSAAERTAVSQRARAPFPPAAEQSKRIKRALAIRRKNEMCFLSRVFLLLSCYMRD